MCAFGALVLIVGIAAESDDMPGGDKQYAPPEFLLLDRTHLRKAIALGGEGDGCEVSVKDIEYICADASIQHIQFTDVWIDQKVYSMLAAQPSLRTVAFSRTNVTDDAIAELSRSRSITGVGVSDGVISGRSLELLGAMPQLGFVSVYRCRLVSRKSMRKMKKTFANITIETDIEATL